MKDLDEAEKTTLRNALDCYRAFIEAYHVLHGQPYYTSKKADDVILDRCNKLMKMIEVDLDFDYG